MSLADKSVDAPLWTKIILSLSLVEEITVAKSVCCLLLMRQMFSIWSVLSSLRMKFPSSSSPTLVAVFTFSPSLLKAEAALVAPPPERLSTDLTKTLSPSLREEKGCSMVRNVSTVAEPTHKTSYLDISSPREENIWRFKNDSVCSNGNRLNTEERNYFLGKKLAIYSLIAPEVVSDHFGLKARGCSCLVFSLINFNCLNFFSCSENSASFIDLIPIEFNALLVLSLQYSRGKYASPMYCLLLPMPNPSFIIA